MVLRLCELHLSSDQCLYDQEGTLHLEEEGMALEEEDMWKDSTIAWSTQTQ